MKVTILDILFIHFRNTKYIPTVVFSLPSVYWYLSPPSFSKTETQYYTLNNKFPFWYHVLGITIPPHTSMILIILGASYKQNHFVCVLRGWLLSPSIINLTVQPRCSMCQHSLPFKGWIVVFSCMYQPHFAYLFILEWTPFFSTMNTALNMYTWMPAWAPSCSFLMCLV